MNRILKLWNLIKSKLIYSLLILSIASSLMDNKQTHVNHILFIVSVTVLIVLTYIEFNIMAEHNKNKLIILSVSLTTLSVIAWLLNSNNSFMSFYYFFLLDNIFDIDDPKSRKSLIFYHMAGFMLYVLIDNILIIKEPFYTNILSYAFAIFVYLLILFMCVCIHGYKYEMNNLKLLNCSLIDYSFKEKEYLLSNERNRISQELHDSLGHLLMALSMNVKYLKTINDKGKINTEVNELELLINKSIQNLRTTVYNLKELDQNFNLYNEIMTIIAKFNNLGMIKITLDYDSNIEKSSINIKNILITTIKESITNSLKHGNASRISISIKLIINTIELIIKDNGDGCKNILKSNGLNGIENRFKKLNGNVNFTSSPKKGFAVNVTIPEVIVYDQSDDSR